MQYLVDHLGGRVNKSKEISYSQDKVKILHACDKIINREWHVYNEGKDTLYCRTNLYSLPDDSQEGESKTKWILSVKGFKSLDEANEKSYSFPVEFLKNIGEKIRANVPAIENIHLGI